MNNSNQPTPVKLTSVDVAQNTVQALLKAIPIAGEPLAHFIFGPLADLRQKRVEQTLKEVGEAIRDAGEKADLRNEYFVNLLERVLPQVSRSVGEARRTTLRNFLVNAAYIRTDEEQYEEATIAAELIEQVAAPGLAVLAAVSRCAAKKIAISYEPAPHVMDGAETRDEKPVATYAVSFPASLVEEWMYRMKAMRLISVMSHDARGGWGGVQLMPLGRLVVKWARDNP